METRLGAPQRRRPPTVHRGSTHAPRLQRPVASEDEATACSELHLGCHPETPVIEPCLVFLWTFPLGGFIVWCSHVSVPAMSHRLLSWESPIMWVDVNQGPYLKAVLLLAGILAGPAPLQAQADNGWIGKRVITQYGTVLQVGNQVVDDEGRGKNLARGKDLQAFRIYKVEQTNGPWLWLVAEGSGVKGWAPATNVSSFSTKRSTISPTRSAPTRAPRPITTGGPMSGGSGKSSTRPSPTTTRPSGSIPGTQSPTTTADSPGTPGRTTTRPSPTITKASGSIPGSPTPTSAAATHGGPRRTSTSPSPTTTRPSGLIPGSHWPTATAAWCFS